jgi:transglutaminase/protease-like cytokinesis protein 3
VEGKADEEGFALAAELLLQKSGLQCRIVKGSKQGKAHLWNIVQLEDEWQHLDLTTDQPTPSGDQSMKAAGYLWSGDIPVCQEILLEVPSGGNG